MKRTRDRRRPPLKVRVEIKAVPWNAMPPGQRQAWRQLWERLLGSRHARLDATEGQATSSGQLDPTEGAGAGT